MTDDTQGREGGEGGEDVENLPTRSPGDAESGEVKGGALNAYVPTDQISIGLLKPVIGGATLDSSKVGYIDKSS